MTETVTARIGPSRGFSVCPTTARARPRPWPDTAPDRPGDKASGGRSRLTRSVRPKAGSGSRKGPGARSTPSRAIRSATARAASTADRESDEFLAPRRATRSSSLSWRAGVGHPHQGARSPASWPWVSLMRFEKLSISSRQEAHRRAPMTGPAPLDEAAAGFGRPSAFGHGHIVDSWSCRVCRMAQKQSQHAAMKGDGGMQKGRAPCDPAGAPRNPGKAKLPGQSLSPPDKGPSGHSMTERPPSRSRLCAAPRYQPEHFINHFAMY